MKKYIKAFWDRDDDEEEINDAISGALSDIGAYSAASVQSGVGTDFWHADINDALICELDYEYTLDMARGMSDSELKAWIKREIDNYLEKILPDDTAENWSELQEAYDSLKF